jgi:hypothetical protein
LGDNLTIGPHFRWPQFLVLTAGLNDWRRVTSAQEMELTPFLTRYLVWAGAVVVGALLSVLDRWIGRPLFGALLVAGIGGGLIMTRVSFFSFGGGDH